MIAKRSRIYLWAALLIAVGCISVAILNLESRRQTLLETFIVGYVLGTLFGQVTVVAFWTAFGPSGFSWRLVLSPVWIGLLLLSFAIGGRFESSVMEFVPTFGACLGAQWIVVQLPLWLLVFLYGLQLRFRNESNGRFSQGNAQFGIRQVMVFTMIVAAFLGVARSLITSELLSLPGREALGFLFLAGAAILITLPLGLAVLLPGKGWLCALPILALVAVATAFELPVAKWAFGGMGPEIMHLVWINTFTSAWVLAFLVAARLSGYQLASSGQAAS